MRYGEFGGPSDLPPPDERGDALPDDLQRLRQAFDEQRYWVVTPEQDGTWALRQLDDTTGLLSEPTDVSGPLAADTGEATGWASELTGVTLWESLSTHPGAWIEAIYTLVREIGRSPRRGRSIVLRIEPDQHTPGLMLVIVRERWDATGLESSPLTTYERTAFRDTAHVLRWASERFGLDPAGWVTVTGDTEYHHP
jgi:hypothetical protein